jgi:hypothetical protein
MKFEGGLRKEENVASRLIGAVSTVEFTKRRIRCECDTVCCVGRDLNGIRRKLFIGTVPVKTGE